MAKDRDAAFRRLLRWYPAGWRAQHAEPMLGMLADDADARGATRPSASDAWSIRVHGLGERLDGRVALLLAAVALAVAVAGGALVLLPIGAAPWLSIGYALGGLLAPALASLALAALLRETRVLGAPAAVVASLTSIAAWALAGGAQVAWSLAFHEADAGAPASLAGGLAVLLALAALACGAAALTPIWIAVLGPGRARRPRWTAAALLSLLCAASLGVFAMMPSGGVVVAVAVLLAAVRARAQQQSVAEVERVPVASPVPPRTALPTPLWSARSTVVLTLLGVIGVGCIGFALSGSSVPAAGLDATQAMNAGLAAGSAVAILTVLCAPRLALPRLRARARVPALLVALGVGGGAAAQLLGAESAIQWPVLLVAALPVGAAAALVSLPHLPGGWVARAATAAGVGAAAAIVAGLPVVMTAPFWAPVLAVVASILAARRRRGGSRSVAAIGSV
ncbi:MAG: hypothetical protein WC580_05335 [Agrococcus sp.]